MKLILALDIGIASVGWAVLDKESETVLEAGSNIFPEASAAGNQVRREMRQARRIKRRQRTRLDDFNKLWRKNNLSKVILESLVPYRMDVYYKESDKSYYMIGIKQSDIKIKNGKNVIDEDIYAMRLIGENMIKPGQSRENLEQLGYEFVFSFYKNDIIEYESKGEFFAERFRSRTKERKNTIETKPIHRDKFENSNDGRKIIGLGKTKSIKKYRTDILGNRYLCEKEKFTKFC